MSIRWLSAFAAASLLSLGPALAGICDYRLSQVIGERAPQLASATADAAIMGRFDRVAPDFFTIVDKGTGFSALGAYVAASQAAAALSGAGTVASTGSAILASPALGMAAGAAVLGMSGLEGVCYFQKERITDYYEVLAVLSLVAETADRDFFQLQLGPPRKKGAVVEVWDGAEGVRKQYRVTELSFVDGELVQKRMIRNKSLGLLMQFEGAVPKISSE